ncbi:GTPase ObgE [Pseudobacteriovorax antillogorgiicola]|uniref:GTPase Obg n=1 Tax=Pseudobacteriovorax antillogorgiicola TaxID=1513793 RepID=A0A1Y6CPB7_9BACT|nr:GTPase ObgE [Pseudobacteriovorax antillogorgiicola]TCS46708.1 GTP-binding protein [Pseudobacteriovorax antillogorgiicola]SMF66971.1 GTP-binding protein [Pseudobacteriovorax antillogorgiicola]
MKFVDETAIHIRSGNGGRGMVSFRAAKNAPKLGADGGDGGFGGSVYLVGNPQLNTLSGLYYKKLYAAGHGERGGSNGCTGKNGQDMIIPVPLGTVAYNKDTGEPICEVLGEEKILVAKGGKRGLGNIRYVSATHQAPEEYTPGGEGLELFLGLELKLIADVGFAGFPNAGKSTLLSAISAARPKVADYPFTTLQPQLGVVDLQDCGDYWDRSFVAADIPGLIEGAHEGKGLGHEFLRHLERTKVIAYVIDPFAWDGLEPIQAYRLLKKELANFGDLLSSKRSILIFTKTDLCWENFEWDEFIDPFEGEDIEIIRLSSVAQKGIKNFKLRLWEIVQEEKEKLEVEVDDKSEVIPPHKNEQEYEMITATTLEQELGQL